MRFRNLVVTSVLALGVFTSTLAFAAAPVIGPVVASPPTVPLNTATVVSFTANIHEATPITGSVQLLRIAGFGKPPSVVGTMYDDGTRGDVASGDGVYTLQVTLTEPIAGAFGFAVTARFSNVSGRILSDLVTISVRQFGRIAASQLIGPSGGNVQVNNSSDPLFGAAVSIPPGALSFPTMISIVAGTQPVLPDSVSPSGPVVDFEPDGLAFLTPVTLTLPVTALHPMNLIYVLKEGAAPVPETSAPSDEEVENPGQLSTNSGLRLTVNSSHFSIRQVLKAWPAMADVLEDFPRHAMGEAEFVPLPISPGAVTNKPCVNCVNPRKAVPIERIVVHSTGCAEPIYNCAVAGAKRQPLANVFAWIYPTIGNVQFVADKQCKFQPAPAQCKPDPACTITATDNCLRRRENNEAPFATYFVFRNGGIVQIVPDNVQTTHAGGNNSKTIGIELDDDTPSAQYSDFQIHNLVALAKRLMSEHDVTYDRVVRHKDVANGSTEPAKHQDPWRWAELDWTKFRNRIKPWLFPGQSFTSQSVTGPLVGPCLDDLQHFRPSTVVVKWDWSAAPVPDPFQNGATITGFSELSRTTGLPAQLSVTGPHTETITSDCGVGSFTVPRSARFQLMKQSGDTLTYDSFGDEPHSWGYGFGYRGEVWKFRLTMVGDAVPTMTLVPRDSQP